MFTSRDIQCIRSWFSQSGLYVRAVVILSAIFWITLLPRVTFAQLPCPNPYIVVRGDILGRIAKNCGVTLAALRAANPQIVDPSKIEIGDRITIPGASVTGDTLRQALANATYQLLTNIPAVIPLINGSAQLPTDHGLLAVSLVEPWAEGAINQDGARDAAVILLEKVEGTTGRFYSLHVLLNTNSILIEAAALSLGDRVRINTLQIQPNGAIVVDLFIQGPSDPMAAATLHVVQTYRLQNGQLLLLSQIPIGEGSSNPGGAVCPNTYPTRLQKGGRAYVEPTPPKANYIRNAPAKNATEIGSIQPGEAMTLLDGPRCADNWVWWYVQADRGGIGWTSEGDAGVYWLAPGERPAVVNPPTNDPRTTVEAFYNALNIGVRSGNLASAYDFLSKARQAGQSYAQFQKDNANVVEVRLESLEVIEQGAKRATISIQYVRRDRENGTLVDYRFKVHRTLVLEGGRWKVDNRRQLSGKRIDTTSPPANGNFLGYWRTNFAEISLHQSGNTVTGSYIQYSRSSPQTISGIVAGNTLSGKAGKSSFSLNLAENGQSFVGGWTGNDGRIYPWCGVREGALPSGCGFSGSWQTNHQVGGWVRLEQVGGDVVGRYFNGTTEGDLTGVFELYGTQQEYSFYGTYRGDNGDRGLVRFRLVDLGNAQFQGCWRDQKSNNTGAWCGWREGGARPAQCLPVAGCP